MSLFWKNNKAVGLDISDLSLKIIQLEKIGDKIRIKAAGKINLPAGIIDKGEIKNREELIKNIRRLFSCPNYGKITTDEVVACLPETKTFLKIIEVDKNAPDFSEEVLKEAEKHIPLSKEEIYCDWQAIKETVKTKIVLIGAAQKELTDKYIDVLREAKLIAVGLENEPLSVCRCLLPEENPKFKGQRLKNYAILDIGASGATLTVYAKNTILFSVPIPISGEQITGKIAQELNVAREQAEKAKIICSLQAENGQPAIKKIMEDMVNNLIFKSREALKFYSDHFSSWGPINQAILCGGGANIKDIEKIISQQLGIPAVRGDVLTNLGGKKEQHLKAFKKPCPNEENNASKAPQDTALLYATAIGLALRGIFN